MPAIALALLVARAAYKTKAEVEELVVSLRPRSAPRDGVRRLPERHEASTATPPAIPTPTPTLDPTPTLALAPAPAVGPAPVSAPTAPARPTVRPVAADTWSLRVTVDAAFKEELDRESTSPSESCCP
ncbi:MAG TPA: hypothetical protein VFP50_03115 [Anaeromyxobacteraceae bacterium]|nr:hypothetical protein [Anaeromyxobacteraceae bacterium]